MPHCVATVRRVARRVGDIMTERVVTVRSDAPVSAAVERMTRFGFSALPVVDGSHRLVGIVSLLDVLRHREEHGSDEGVMVESVMTRDVLSMSPLANVSVVAHRLRTYGELRVLPVVERGTLVGVVTRSDLLRPRKREGRIKAMLRRLGGGDSAEEEALLGLTRPHRAGPTPAAGASVREVMTTDVVTADVSLPVEQAAELLVRHRLTALPVVDQQQRLLGVVSEADLLGDPLSGRREARTVGGVMTREPVVLRPGSTVGEARKLIADRGLRVVPVVENGLLVGVLSRRDVV